jgi:hypothetical protein
VKRLALIFVLLIGCSESTTVAPETEQAAPSCNASLGDPVLSGNTVSVPVTLGSGVEFYGLEYAWAVFRPADKECIATTSLLAYPATWDGATLTWTVDRTSFEPLEDNLFRMEIVVWVQCADAGTVMLATPCVVTSF